MTEFIGAIYKVKGTGSSASHINVVKIKLVGNIEDIELGLQAFKDAGYKINEWDSEF